MAAHGHEIGCIMLLKWFFEITFPPRHLSLLVTEIISILFPSAITGGQQIRCFQYIANRSGNLVRSCCLFQCHAIKVHFGWSHIFLCHWDASVAGLDLCSGQASSEVILHEVFRLEHCLGNSITSPWLQRSL